MSPAVRAGVVKQHLEAGTKAITAGDADAVIREARAVLEADETSVEAMITLAHGFYLKGYDDKTEAILQLAKKNPAGEQSPLVWMLLGLVADRGGTREDEALAAYEKALLLKPDYAAAMTNAGAIYLKRKRYADAVTTFENVVRLDPKSVKAHTHLGAAYRGRSGDVVGEAAQRDDFLRKAEKELHAAVKQDPGYAPAQYNMGLLYLDADPFPGLETIPRLQAAMKYMSDFKQAMGPNLKAGDPVDEYMAGAEKSIDRETKRLDKKRKRDEEKKQKEAEKAQKEAAEKAAAAAAPASQPTASPSGGAQ